MQIFSVPILPKNGTKTKMYRSFNKIRQLLNTIQNYEFRGKIENMFSLVSCFIILYFPFPVLKLMFIISKKVSQARCSGSDIPFHWHKLKKQAFITKMCFSWKEFLRNKVIKVKNVLGFIAPVIRKLFCNWLYISS